MSVRAVVFVIALLPSTAQAAIPPPQRDALVAFYNGLNGDGWTRRDNWNGAPGTECQWYGVKCDTAGTGVVELRLPQNHLSGTLTPKLADLSALQVLVLDYNNDITGPIPGQITQLLQLQELSLSGNRLTGEIPRDIGKLAQLRTLSLFSNQLTGTIPDGLGDLSRLTYLHVAANKLTGTVPLSLLRLTQLSTLATWDNVVDGTAIFARIDELPALNFLALGNANLSGRLPIERFLRMQNLRTLSLPRNKFDGSIPPQIGDLKLNNVLDLSNNRFSGGIPVEFAKMVDLGYLELGGNELTGSIPPALGSMRSLVRLNLQQNKLTGTIPPEIGNLAKLEQLLAGENRLSGSIPRQLGNLTKLFYLNLWRSSLSGPIPSELGQLTELQQMYLSSNLLSGAIPRELGNLSKLQVLELTNNTLRGEVPREIANLSQIRFGLIGGNALTASDAATAAYLDRSFRGWSDTQTIPPTGVAVSSISGNSAVLTWNAIRYGSDPGGYQVGVSTVSGGPYAPLVTTPNKFARSVVVTGLQPLTRYFAIVKTITFAHGVQPNTIFSDPTPEIAFTTTAASPGSAQIVIDAVPPALAQPANTGGASVAYHVTNIGGGSANVSLSQSGTFFNQTPLTFSLGPGQSQAVTITALPQPEGSYSGTAVADGGAAGRISIPVRLLSSASIAAPRLQVSTRRIDLVTTATQTVSGSFNVTNASTVDFVGVVAADVEWITPPANLIRISPGDTQTVTFTADPSKRPDPSLLTGTVTGTVSLITLSSFLGKKALDNGPGTSGGEVSVSLTTAVNAEAAAIPPLPADQVAFFVPGAGHVVGSVGLFLSDISIFNSVGTRPANDVKLYFKPTSSAPSPFSATVDRLGTEQSVVLADVVKNIFRGDAQVGSLQLRAADWPSLTMTANVLNVTNPAGTYGTALPIFRSDRSASSGTPLFLSGLRKDPNSHTNIFLQETRGLSGSLVTDFFAGDGSIVGTRTDAVGAFELKQINDVVPAGAVMARIQTSSPGMAFQAYATPVDHASGDNWSIADWTRQYAYDPSEEVSIVVAGAAHGAGDTYFRTDAVVTNIECLSQQQREFNLCGTTDVLLTYHANSGATVERTITIEPFHTAVLDDIVSNNFQMSESIGYITVRPARGNLVVNSRTYATRTGSAATFGTGVPTLSNASAIRAGQFRRLAAIDDAPIAATNARTPATFRNNIGLIEVLGQPVTVRLTLAYLDARAKVAANVVATKDFQLAAGQSSQFPLATTLLGSGREDLGNLHNLRLTIEVIGGAGGILAYLSSVDNGTGDSILRIE